MRKVILAEGEHYHVFNRGVEKRDIFMDHYDLARFLTSIPAFNVMQPIGSLYQQSFKDHKSQLGSLAPKLVEIVSYCLNPNHFHLLLRQTSARGIQQFMQRLGTGYTNYFNEKYSRSGSLFQGPYKAVHIESNEQLLHTSVYVNLNNHFGSLSPKLSASSWEEYRDGKQGICRKEIILEQFRTPREYVSFAERSLDGIVEKKQQEKEARWLLGS